MRAKFSATLRATPPKLRVTLAGFEVASRAAEKS
jgi:hypothetical protein